MFISPTLKMLLISKEGWYIYDLNVDNGVLRLIPHTLIYIMLMNFLFRLYWSVITTMLIPHTKSTVSIKTTFLINQVEASGQRKTTYWFILRNAKYFHWCLDIRMYFQIFGFRKYCTSIIAIYMWKSGERIWIMNIDWKYGRIFENTCETINENIWHFTEQSNKMFSSCFLQSADNIHISSQYDGINTVRRVSVLLNIGRF